MTVLAGVGTGVFKDELAAVRQCLKLDRELSPNADRAAFYAKQFKHYRSIHDALAPSYACMQS